MAIDIPSISMPPRDVAILAAVELAKGKTLDQICETVRENLDNPGAGVQTTSAGDQPFDPDKEKSIREFFMRRYYTAYLRIVTGQIFGLELEELDDCAMISQMPGVDFETWLQKKGLDNRQ